MRCSDIMVTTPKGFDIKMNKINKKVKKVVTEGERQIFKNLISLF